MTNGRLMSCRLACLGRCSLPDLFGSSSQRWCFLGLPFGYPSLCSSGAIVPLSYDSVYEMFHSFCEGLDLPL